ncbi:unnamed protein product [Prunus armeniaca]
MATDVLEQTFGAVEGVADQMDAEEVVDQGSLARILDYFFNFNLHCILQTAFAQVSTDKFRNCDLPGKEIRSQTNSHAERQRDANIPLQSLSRLHQSRNEDRTGRITHPPNHRDPTVEPQAVKHEADSASLTSSEARMANTKNARESSTRVNGSSEMLMTDPNIDKSNPGQDACVSNLFKMNFLSNPSACVKLVDHIH